MQRLEVSGAVRQTVKGTTGKHSTVISVGHKYLYSNL